VQVGSHSPFFKVIDLLLQGVDLDLKAEVELLEVEEGKHGVVRVLTKVA
jgi:hypothetical protein